MNKRFDLRTFLLIIGAALLGAAWAVYNRSQTSFPYKEEEFRPLVWVIFAIPFATFWGWAIARPGEPGGETWGNLPLNRRSGGDAWIPGSYDPGTGLWDVGSLGPGASQTLVLRVLVVSPDARTNSASLARSSWRCSAAEWPDARWSTRASWHASGSYPCAARCS